MRSDNHVPLLQEQGLRVEMAETPAALQLRLLQTMVEVAAEKNSTLVLPFPVEMLRYFEAIATGKPAAPRGPERNEDRADESSILQYPEAPPNGRV